MAIPLVVQRQGEELSAGIGQLAQQSGWHAMAGYVEKPRPRQAAWICAATPARTASGAGPASGPTSMTGRTAEPSEPGMSPSCPMLVAAAGTLARAKPVGGVSPATPVRQRLGGAGAHGSPHRPPGGRVPR